MNQPRQKVVPPLEEYPLYLADQAPYETQDSIIKGSHHDDTTRRSSTFEEIRTAMCGLLDGSGQFALLRISNHWRQEPVSFQSIQASIDLRGGRRSAIMVSSPRREPIDVAQIHTALQSSYTLCHSEADVSDVGTNSKVYQFTIDFRPRNHNAMNLQQR